MTKKQKRITTILIVLLLIVILIYSTTKNKKMVPIDPNDFNPPPRPPNPNYDKPPPNVVPDNVDIILPNQQNDGCIRGRMGSPSPIGCFENKPDPVIIVEPPIRPPRPQPEPRPDIIVDPPNPYTNGNDVVDPVVEPPAPPPRPRPRPDVPPRPRPKPSTPPRPTPSTYDGCGCNEPVSSSGSQECKKYLWQYMNEPRPRPNGTTTTTTTTNNEIVNNGVVTEDPIYGCTDPTYSSYNQNATVDDGSCTNFGFDPTIK